MRVWIPLPLLVLLAGAAAWAIDDEGPMPDPELQARFERITEELRCLVCQNQTIADSNADLARDLRSQARRMLLEGATDDEVRIYMTDRYGDFVLYRPPLSPRTWLLWSAPVLLLLIGLLSVTVVIRRRSMATDLPQVGEEALPDPDREAGR